MVVEISDWNDLDDVRNNLNEDYVLVNDLDEDTDGYTDIGDDFEPIGYIEDEQETNEFGGSFNGDGFAIKDLNIEFTGSSDGDGDIGLFASTDGGAVIENLIVEGSVTVDDRDNVGGLIGYHEENATIKKCVVNAQVDADTDNSRYVGGLVGYNAGDILNCYSLGDVTGSSSVGGFVGRYTGEGDNIEFCYSTGEVSAPGTDFVGGFAGSNDPDIGDGGAEAR